jgi:hypothetical protein
MRNKPATLHDYISEWYQVENALPQAVPLKSRIKSTSFPLLNRINSPSYSLAETDCEYLWSQICPSDAIPFNEVKVFENLCLYRILIRRIKLRAHFHGFAFPYFEHGSYHIKIFNEFKSKWQKNTTISSQPLCFYDCRKIPRGRYLDFNGLIML